MTPRGIVARASEMLLRIVMRDREAYDGLLGDLREEVARSSDRGTAGVSGYSRMVLGLAVSYAGERLRGGGRRAPRKRRGISGALGGWTAAVEDLRLAARLLRRRPGFALAAVATSSLGFGAAAAVLSVAYGVWLRPLPFAQGEDLVRIYELRLDGGGLSRLSPPLLNDLRTHRWSSLAGVAAVGGVNYDWEHDDGRERLFAHTASRGAFDLLGLEPVAGRFFSPGPGSREVVLGEGLWRRAFGASDEVVGSESLLLDGDRYLIVGVVHDDLPYPRGGGVLWTPLDPSADELSEGMRGARYLDVIGRMRPGATLAAAADELDAFVRGLGAEHAAHDGWGATAVSLREDLIRPFTGVLRLLLAAAALFLLIACSNVAGLLATRRVRSRAERDLRRALGASRGRMVRQDLAEMLLVAIASAPIAAMLAIWSMAPLRWLAPADLPRIAEIRPDPVVIGVIAATMLIVCAVLALVGGALDRGPRRGAAGRARGAASPSTPRSALMVGQVAATTVLLLAGAAIGNHFLSLARVSPGFDAEGLAVAPVLLSERTYPDEASRLAFFEDLVAGLQQRGHAAAFGVNPPMSGTTMRFGYQAGDGTVTAADERHSGQHHVVTPEYFSVLGIPLRSGRAFTAADRGGSTPVVIINETLARAHYAGDPVGEEMTVVGTRRQIVGVVGSVSHLGPDRDPPPEMYLPLAQEPGSFGHVLIRSTGGYPPDAAREVAAAIDPAVPVPALFPYGDYLRSWFAPLRFQLTVVSLLAAAGGLLAMVGLYALIAFVVAGRTREIGIRAALGESGRSIFAGVVGHGVALTAAGLVIGAGGALALRRALGSAGPLGDGIEAVGLAVPAVVALVVLGAATAATAWPARWASRVDPVEALRRD